MGVREAVQVDVEERMSGRFVSVDRDTAYLLPPSVQDWLPEDHLARFVAEIVERMDLGTLTTAYRGRGSDAYHPAMMVALLFYGYATGVFSSRQLERATYDSVAFRYVAANEHPDHDTIANFRKRFLKELSELFVQILSVAQQMGLLKLGKVSLDGTKVHANASKHSALSGEHASKIEAQLKAEVEQLMHLAEEADGAQVPDGMSVPEELGFEQAYNAQAAVDVETMLVVEQHVSQNPNDKQEVKPTLANLDAVAPEIGKAEAILGDTGYFSADNVDQCEAHGVAPYLAAGRHAHYPPLEERLSAPAPIDEAASPVERMKHRLRTPEGRAIYAKRKSTIEPTFGIIKSVLGFRQFLLRGLQAVGHEWTLVCIGWNLKRMHQLRAVG